MSRSLNRCTFIGKLGRDAETKDVGGSTMTSFSIACDRSWKDKTSGEWKKETDWINLKYWNAGVVAGYLVKGKEIYVEGRMQVRSYENKEGAKVWATDVICEQVILLGGGDRTGEAVSQPRGRSAPVGKNDSLGVSAGDLDDWGDPVPF